MGPDFLSKIRNKAEATLGTTPDQVNIIARRQDIEDRLKLENGGAALAELFAIGEWRICLRLGLIQELNPEAYLIPSWSQFITHLRLVDAV